MGCLWTEMYVDACVEMRRCSVALMLMSVRVSAQAVKCQGLDLDSLLPDQEMLMKIMVHPLQIQVGKCLSPCLPICPEL